MSLEPYSRRQLTFITTDNCTADCPHCIMHARPGKKHALSFAQMKQSIDAYQEKAKLLLVIFTGGEPTLLGEELFRTIRYCAEQSILTRIVTNCHWAGTEERAKAMLRKLREAGLNEINFSMDDYHAPYVPIENVRRAWRNTKGMGFSAVVIANCHGEGDTITPAFITEYLEENIAVRDADNRKRRGPNEKPDEYGTLYIIAEGRLLKSGRAKNELAEDERYYQYTDERLKGGCGCVLEECAISYDNKLWACCGVQGENNPVLCIGDLKEKTLNTLLKKGSDSVLLNAIHYYGPFSLREMLLKADPTLELHGDYHNVCELCEAITTDPRSVAVLRKSIPGLAISMRSLIGIGEDSCTTS